MPFGLFLLGLTVFCIGTTEVMISGLLPALSHDLHVSIPTAGLLISGFALSVTIGGPLLTAALLRTARKQALAVLLLTFIAGQTVGAVAPDYAVLMTGRVVSALAMGAFFGIGAVAAVDLTGPDARGKALAVMFGGLTIANVLGLPAATFLGDHFGWRSSFWAVDVLAVACLAGLLLRLPAQSSPVEPNLRGELSGFSNGRLWHALATNALAQAACFCAFSYLSPLLIDVTHFSPGTVPVVQLLFGAGSLLGITIGGRYADRYPVRNLYVGLGALTAVLALLTVGAHNRVATVVLVPLFGLAIFGSTPALGARVMRESSDSPLAASVNTSSFNVGNTIGPWLGGIGISAGLGFTSPAWIGSLLAATSLAAVAGAEALWRRPGPAPAAAPTATLTP